MSSDLLHRAARVVHTRGADLDTPPDHISEWLAATPDLVAKALTAWLLAQAELHDIAGALQPPASALVVVATRGEAETLARLIVGET